MLNDAQTAKLKDHIAMPDWERRLIPLFTFKGTKPYAARSMFNVAYSMFLAEETHIPTVNEALFFKGHGQLGHICGKHCKQLDNGSVRSIFSRLRGRKEFTDSFGKDFTEFVEYVHPYPCVMQEVPRCTGDRKKISKNVWWRYLKPKKVAKKKIIVPRLVQEPVLAYPFIRAKPRSDHELLLAVHSCIPSHVPHDVRGDLCQDLIVAILSGETTLENIQDVMHEHAKAAKKLMPDRFKTVSLDAVIPGTDGFTLMDKMSARHECCD